MTSAFHLQIGRETSPNAAEKRAPKNGNRQGDQPLGLVQPKTDECHTKSRHTCLAFAADIELRCMKSNGDRSACKDKAGGIVQRKANAIAAAQRTDDHQAHRLKRVFADEGHDDARYDKGEGYIQDRDQSKVDPFG